MDVALARLDAVAQADLRARGAVTARELHEACLARIAALNPLLRAVVTVAERPPPPRSGPLEGVPFLAKDSLPWPGMRWSMGARLFASNVARQHAPVGSRLEAAGLVCVGKSSMSELGLLASTETLLEGVTHNPWDLACSAGGSSGGSAAAVAAGLVPVAHASDGGGSIRVPASACGVFGFKPSRGRTFSGTLVASPFDDLTSEHVVSRSVRDSALVLSLVEDSSSFDPVGFVREPIGRSLRIATWTTTLTGGAPEPGVARALEDTVSLLSSLGHVVEPVPAPTFDVPALTEAFMLVSGAAAASIVDATDQRRGSPVQTEELEPFTWALVEAFLARGPDALAWARAQLARAVHAYRDATRGHDVVLTPTVGVERWAVGFLSPVLERPELERRTARVLAYTPIQNAAGCPAMSVPLTFPEGGIPIGSHFAAAPGRDAVLLGLAYQLEAARPWRDRWPPLSIPVLHRA